MLYTGRHSLSLVRIYSETFGQPVPEASALKAARAGRAQDLMQAVDEAIKANEPIQDWTPFERPLRTSSTPIEAVAS